MWKITILRLTAAQPGFSRRLNLIFNCAVEYKGIEMIPSKKLTVSILTVDNDQYNLYKKSRRQGRKICKKKTVLTQPFWRTFTSLFLNPNFIRLCNQFQTET